MFKRITYAVIFFIFLSYSIFAKAEEAYYPHPIIFVHGINSNSSTWVTTRPEIEKYFYDEATNKCKYFTITNPYVSAINYPDKGDIRTSALAELKNAIDDAIKGLPDDQKKVIVVAHSMGGLVTRVLLGLLADYENKIDRVVFIGTPHIGSPYASAVWLLDKIRSEIIYPALADYSSFYSMNVGTHFRFSDSSSFLAVSGLPSQIYDDLSSKLQKEAKRFDTALSWPDGQGLTQSIALEQLRLNQAVIFQKSIKSSLKGKKNEIILYGQILGNETFLGQANYLAIPPNFKVIMCQNPRLYTLAGGIKHLKFMNSLLLGIPNLLTLAIDNFSYPSNLSIIDAVNTGDGIVPQASQEGIRTPADYTITSFHVGETNHYQTILQAIDDVPQIERIRVIAQDETQHSYATPYYIIFKLKEYLLADVEVLSLKLDGTNVSPGDGYNPINGDDFQSTEPYKPYDDVAYPEKGFLKERDVPNAFVTDIEGNETPLRLYPGEFHITVSLTYGKHEIKIKLKNAANKETDELTYYISMPKIYNLYNTTTYYFVSGDGTRYPQEVKYGYINVPPLQPTEQPDDAWIDTQTKISFSIADELFNQFKVDVWIYDRYGHTLIRKLYQKPVTLSGSEGNYYGNFQTFCTWYGRDDYGRDVPDQSYYKVKIIATPVDDSYILPQSDPPDLKQCLIATSQDYPNEDLIYADPSFVQASREPQDLELISENEKSFYKDNLYANAPPNTIIDITDLSNEELTCKIQVPFPNSLVRADVPIFGLAYGKDFKQYKLEYAEGLNPTTWKQIITSTKPHVDTRLIKEIASAGATIRGNLGTWDTGLTEYEHNNKKHKADLNGIYSLKLTVYDTNGNTKEDRVTVQVGRVISFAFGGKATSPDGKAEVIIPEHSIKDSFEVMGILEVNDTSIRPFLKWYQEGLSFRIKEKHSLKSKAYKIVPEEYFTEPAALKIKLDNGYKGKLGDLKICAYDITKDEHFLLPTEIDMKDNTICANVTYLSSGYYYAAVEVKDDEPALMYPAREEQPDYAIALTKEPFDLKKHPIVSFDYICKPDTKLNLIAKVGNRYYDIRLNDDPKTYFKNNLKKIGEIDNFIADGNRHSIEIDLYSLLSKFTSTVAVEQLLLVDFDASGYMELYPGNSNLKKSLYVENLRIEERSKKNSLAIPSKDPSWVIGIDDDDPTEFELETSIRKDYLVGVPFDRFNRAITPDAPISNIEFNLTKNQTKSDYLLTLDVVGVDTSKKGYVRFIVLLNGKPLQTLQASHWQGEIFQIPIRSGLKKRKNILTFKWLDGGSWVTWDYISFQQL